MAAIAKGILYVGSKISENVLLGDDTQLDPINDQDEVEDRPGEDYDDEGDEGYDDKGEEANADNKGSNEKGSVDDDNQPSNATDDNDSTENPTEPNGEGGNASSAAKETETEKEPTSDNNNNPAAANNANTTAPPPSRPETRMPQGQPQQQPQLKEQQPVESDPTPQPPKRRQNQRKPQQNARPPPQKKESGSPPRTQRQPQENKASYAPQNTQLLPQQQQLEAQLAKPMIPCAQDKVPIPSGVVAPLNGNEANVSAPKTQIKKESVPPPRELQEQPQVNNASDAPPKKQPLTRPVTETQAKSIPSVQEKAPCPSSSVTLPTPEDDAATLYRAFKGKGCDVGKVVQILAQRDSTHRNQIAQLYKKNYEEELSDRISSEFSRIGLLGDLKEQVGVDLTVNPTGSFSLFCNDIKRAITLWLLNESERDATIVWQSLQVTSLDRAAVTEVICSRTPSQLRRLKQAYFTKYGSRLLEDISASTFRFYGYHKELLIACLDDKTAREEGTNVDPKMAEEDAKQLYKDGEKIWGTNEKTFVEIFTKRNRPHLAAVDAAYEKLYGHSLEEAVKKETSGSFEAGLLTLLRCAKNSAKYFAEVLYNAMNGLGTSNTILLRTVVTKAGSFEMEDIKKEYSVAYKISLADAIHKDTSGHYRTFLINLVE